MGEKAGKTLESVSWDLWRRCSKKKPIALYGMRLMPYKAAGIEACENVELRLQCSAIYSGCAAFVSVLSAPQQGRRAL